MTEQTSSVNSTLDNTRTVETFLYALQDQDFDRAQGVVADNLVWENAGWPTMRGGRRVINIFRSMAGRGGFEVKIHRIAAEGTAVLTERTDALVFGPIRVHFWVCGAFEVHAGRITHWRDYFDVYDFLKGTLRGIAGAVIPSLRPTM
ncbi:MAG: limonene-1,2-epoxide hydrolase family protein [Mycobacterium sp.]